MKRDSHQAAASRSDRERKLADRTRVFLDTIHGISLTTPLHIPDTLLHGSVSGMCYLRELPLPKSHKFAQIRI